MVRSGAPACVEASLVGALAALPAEAAPACALKLVAGILLLLDAVPAIGALLQSKLLQQRSLFCFFGCRSLLQRNVLVVVAAAAAQLDGRSSARPIGGWVDGTAAARPSSTQGRWS
jgi:hypothetical protein